jgi:hypothetical protein
MAKKKVVKRRKSPPSGGKKPLVPLNLLYAVLILAIVLVALSLIKSYLASF